MKGLRLIATGGALPGRTVTNEELSRTVDTSDEWITTRTGIRTRHWCAEGETAATLAIAAARQALARSGLSPADIGCCVCATLSAPDATPSVACQVQAALGLPEKFLIKPPSDGLTGLTDEDNLGFTYHAVNEYIRRGVVDEKIKADIDRKHAASRFKFQTLPVYQNGLPIVLEEPTDYYNPNKK